MTLNIHLYNLLHTGNPGDLEFYLHSCKGAGSVLELGCGNGRVGIALAKQGTQVTGVDVDSGMVEAFKAAAKAAGSVTPGSVDVVCADMRSFQLDQKYSKVLIPFNGLLCMLSEDDIIACLTCARAHLEEGGELIFDVYYVPEDLKNEGEEDEYFEEMGVIEDEGVPVRVYEKTFVLPDPQRFDTAYQLVYEDGDKRGETHEFTIEQRCIYLADMERLLGAAGFKLKGITSDFSSGKISSETDQAVVRAV